MPDDELAQALQEQRLVGLEKNAVELVAKALQIPEETVVRVMFAFNQLATAFERASMPLTVRPPENTELCDAIKFAMEEGVRRLILRHAIENGRTFSIHVSTLVPKNDVAQLCHGCPERLECVADSLHTPEECFTTHKATLHVFPIRVVKNLVEVEATQPAGRHFIPISAFRRRTY